MGESPGVLPKPFVVALVRANSVIELSSANIGDESYW